MSNKIDLIQQYRQKVLSANKELTKKEAFKDLLNRLYAADKDILQIIDKITLGAETSIINIPRKNKRHRGSADTFYNRIIIEFENNLKTSGKHAKEQLAGYLLGQFNSGEGYHFTLIASDLIEWRLYAPDISCLDKLDMLSENELILNEIENSSFILTENNAEDFYYWMDRFLFKEEIQKATLKNVEEFFGYQSHVFIESFRELTVCFDDAKKFGEVQVSFEQWRKFLSIAYGSFDASESNFLIHTYLSVFSKLLAYAVMSNNDYIDDKELLQTIDGSIFHNFNITNFVDNDFFRWIKSERSFNRLKKVFRLIAQEISTFDFEKVDEDILKGVYQELIDLDTRHALGEYYTPDWLCERIVDEFVFKSTDKILDPACGSGSFIRAAIHKIRKDNPSLDAAQINNMVYGIDIHPLSVQISKTTLLLALGKEIIHAKKPVHLNIILANTLLAPEGEKNLWGSEFSLSIDKDKYPLNTKILEDVQLFDSALDVCDDLAEQTMNKDKVDKESFSKILGVNRNGLTNQLTDSFYAVYEGLKKVKEKGRNGIWKFIIQNIYKPYFLADKIDYVVGNPPWFTYSSVKNEEYQNILHLLAEKYGITPNVKDYPHLEIAAIFLAYCTNYFLKPEGKAGFVLPRSFFNAGQHDHTRSGVAKGFKLTSIWDFEGIAPLFRVPACVLFAQKTEEDEKRAIPASGLGGLSFSGNLPAHNCNYETAQQIITEDNVTWFYAKQGKSTAFSTRKSKKQTAVNPYKSKFKQGATIVPRNLYFVELTQATPPDFEERIINLKTSESVKTDAKAPWKDISLSGQIESRFIFRTALSKSLLPFAMYQPDMVALPINVEKDGITEDKSIKLWSADKLMNEGYLKASRRFTNIEDIWKAHRKEKSGKMSSGDRIDFHKGLTSQNLNLPYLVLYNSSAKDANATVIKRENVDFEFIVESVAYVYYTSNINEAHYLAAILNSTIPNMKMKDFQAKGLFGARHVHKKILDVYFPKFNEKNERHLQLSEWSKTAHEKTAIFLKNNPPPSDLTAIKLGRLRVEIKKYLKTEISEIDKIVKKIL